jgi:YVTN family beta-propeller protein
MRIFILALTTLVVFSPVKETRGEPRRAAAITSGPTVNPAAPLVGATVTFMVTATSSTGSNLIQWDFGDGSGLTSFTINDFSHTHTYANPGHYKVTVYADENPATGTVVNASAKFVVHWPLPAARPTNSSTIILDAPNNHVWVVNPDQDTVAVINTGTNTTLMEVAVGKNPRTLAQAADGTIWVVSQQHPSISVLHPTTFALLHVIPLPHGSLPYGICMTPDGSAAYVSFQGLGGVQKISTSSRGVLASSTVPPSARGIAVSPTGRVLVTRFLSPVQPPLTLAAQAASHGEVVELDSNCSVVRTFNLAMDPGPGTPDPDITSPPTSSTSSRGIPNYLTSLVITPDGRRAWVPSKKDNIQRGTSTARDGRTPSFEVTYRAIVSSLDLVNNVEPALVPATEERFDPKNSEMPQAACTSPLGDYLFVALQGNNRIQIRDLFPIPSLPPLPPTINGMGDLTGTTATNGLSPQGLVLNPANSKLYVQNYMARSVSVFDTTNVLNGTTNTLGVPSAVIPTVLTADLLGAAPLIGKQIFYNASDPRMSMNSYISCAGCHLDGGSDARVWDFTDRGEGLRNTTMLQGRGNGAGGMKHGNVHWSANFDEIQDFENDIQNHFGGTGFSGGAPNPPMGAPNAGRNANLDALAAYVTSLSKVSRSPFRNADGSLTASGARGELVFVAQNCASCHTTREFTDSTLFTLAPPAVATPGVHNVGTLKSTSGQRLGMTLMGIDTPTLKGVWQTAPYFHDGSAAALADVVAALGSTPLTLHGGGTNPLTGPQQADLVEYLLELDEIEPGDRLSTDPPVTVAISVVDTGRPYSLATAVTGSLAFVDRSYTLTTSPLSANVNGKILLRTSEDDKLDSAASHISITLTSGADFYVYYDSRATKQPTWLDGTWTPSPADNITLSPGLLMKAFKKTFAAGTVTLGGNQQGGPTGALRNYFVIINQAGSVFEEGPISQLEWVHDHDADGDGLHDEYEAVKGSNPWVANSVSAGLADEDQIVSGTTTAFQDQIAFETPPAPPSGGGGGGGCGFLSLEFLLPLVFLRRLRNKWSRRDR